MDRLRVQRCHFTTLNVCRFLQFNNCLIGRPEKTKRSFYKRWLIAVSLYISPIFSFKPGSISIAAGRNKTSLFPFSRRSEPRFGGLSNWSIGLWIYAVRYCLQKRGFINISKTLESFPELRYQKRRDKFM